MGKMWAGRFKGALDKQADDFNSSFHFDNRMYKQDISGSVMHAKMLGDKKIITEDEKAEIIKGLSGILTDIESGKLPLDSDAEDIHMFIEEELTKRIGDSGKRLHTARSRNDQVALDIRMYMANECEEIGRTYFKAYRRNNRQGKGKRKHNNARLHPFAARAAHNLCPPHFNLRLYVKA